MDKFTKNCILISIVIFIVVTFIVFFGGYFYEAKWFVKNIFNPKTSQVSDKDFEIQDVDFRPYMSEVHNRIKNTWNPPHTNVSAKVEVSFDVGKNGHVENIKILKSSGDEITDKAITDTLNKISPLPPLPIGFKQENLKINYTFEIKANK